MKKIITCLSAVLFMLPAFAQKDAAAKKVLDKTAATLTSMKAIKTNFEITSFAGNTSQGTTSGVMYLDGNKYKTECPELITWYDGKTQWAYVPENDEVNVCTPTKEELQTTNLYAFVGLYKKGYNYTMTEQSSNGKKTYEIRLTAENKGADIQEARINVDANYIPFSIRVRQGSKNWTRIRVSNLQGKQKFAKDTFTFPTSKYPTAEIIDLR